MTAILRRHSAVVAAGRISAATCLRPGLGAVRFIRAGFFADDEDYIDPDLPLFAERVGSRWRYMDDPTLRAPVLERNNVGMGMLVLNSANGLDLPTINTIYTRLRNLEVNTLKRFVGFTAQDTGPFCLGLKPRELLLAATAAEMLGRLPHFSRALLWHHQELAHLIADYRKPFICQISGEARNGGAALACHANFGGAYDESEIRVDACSYGLVPDAGMTYVLGRLKWELGTFLALTGWPVRGADLVYSELVTHWLSPEALPFLELTSETQLEVSESDARALLHDHSLPLPDGFGDDDSLPAKILPLVNRAFEGDSLADIVKNLTRIEEDWYRNKEDRLFAKACLNRMKHASPLALEFTLRLIRIAQDRVYQRGIEKEQTMDGALMHMLRLELRAQEHLLCHPDSVVGLKARCLGHKVPQNEWSHNLHNKDLRSVVNEVLQDGEGSNFSVWPRSEFSLSQHPRLRRYHPDYNPVTGMDHDPEFMAAEVERWSPDFFCKRATGNGGGITAWP